MDQIESELLASTAPVALRSYGVAIEQIRLERIALPEENVTAVFEQMRAERRQFAAKFQAEGEREASRIRSEAELEAARISAKGAEEEARIRGESAAQVARSMLTLTGPTPISTASRGRSTHSISSLPEARR